MANDRNLQFRRVINHDRSNTQSRLSKNEVKSGSFQFQTASEIEEKRLAKASKVVEILPPTNTSVSQSYENSLHQKKPIRVDINITTHPREAERVMSHRRENNMHIIDNSRPDFAN